MTTHSTGGKPPPDPMAAAAAARVRRLRRFEIACWSAGCLFAVAWALSLFFQFHYRASTSSIELYDSVMRFRLWKQPVELDPGPLVRAGWIDRAGDLPWVERLGLTLPCIGYDTRWRRYDNMGIDLPMWLIVGFYAALAARFCRRRLHPDWQPRGSRLRAATWTLATLVVAALTLFAALGAVEWKGSRCLAVAKMNRLGFAWETDEMPIPEASPSLSLVERWAIEPPVFAARSAWQNSPELVVCVPAWMLLAGFSLMTIRAWRRVKPLPPNLCKRCRYNLTGNTSGKCSECGRVIDWDIHGTRQ